MQQRREAGVLLVADVFSHLDGGDRLVLTAFDIAVVTQLDVDQVVEATLAHAGEDGVALFAGEGHGRHLDLVVFGRVQGECTPTAADVEQPRSWPQPQLAADQFQLVALRFAQAVFGVLTCPEGAGVRHRRIEQQLVELVGQVVVVADGRAVATGGVASTQQPRAPRGGGWPGAEGPEPGGCESGSGNLRRPRPGGGGLRALPQGAQSVTEVPLDVQIARDVGLGQAELSRLPEQPTQRAA